MELGNQHDQHSSKDYNCSFLPLIQQWHKCCCCPCNPIIMRNFEHVDNSSDGSCDKLVSCNLNPVKPSSIQPRNAKNTSSTDIYAKVISHHCQYTLYKMPLKVCPCGHECYCMQQSQGANFGSSNKDMQVEMCMPELQNDMFPRKCFSLPHCYRHNITVSYNRDVQSYNYHTQKDKVIENFAFTSFTHKVLETQCGYNYVRKKKNSPTEFKMKLDTMKKWFSEFSDEQKNNMLKSILDQCGVAQTHLLSLQMATTLHNHCPKNCEDPFSWLPQNIALYILSFMDPVSLCQCSQVCRTWNDLASEPVFWQYFCHLPKWQLSRAGEQKQMITFRLANGSIDWKRAFAERFRLNRNWLKGYCHVRTFHGHSQGVFCVQFDDTRIVSGSSDKTIKVWNIRTNSPWSVMTLVGHSGTVRCLHLEGNRLVSGSSDCSIKVWDLSTQHTWSSIACKVTMIGHADTVRCLQVDDEKVVSGSYDHSLKVWDIKTGMCKMTLRGHEGAVLCLQFDEMKIISGSGDKTIKIWRLSQGDCTLTLTGHEDAVTCLQFDVSKIISGSLDRTIKFWNLKDGSCLSTLDWMKSEGHTGVVRCLQADRWRIVSAGDDKTLKVWSLETGKRLVTLRNHSDGVTCLQFNDSVIVSGSYDQTVKLWDFSVC